MKKVVLIGVSGFVGLVILNEVLNCGFYVMVVVCYFEKIKIENENLEVKRVDVFLLDEVCKVCKGVDVVISVFNLGWNNFDIYKEIIEVYLMIIDGVKKVGVNCFLMVGGVGLLFIVFGI